MVEVRGRTEVTWRKEALVPMSGDRCVSKMPEGEETGSSCERLEDMKRSHLQHHGVIVVLLILVILQSKQQAWHVPSLWSPSLIRGRRCYTKECKVKVTQCVCRAII